MKHRPYHYFIGMAVVSLPLASIAVLAWAAVRAIMGLQTWPTTSQACGVYVLLFLAGQMAALAFWISDKTESHRDRRY